MKRILALPMLLALAGCAGYGDVAKTSGMGCYTGPGFQGGPTSVLINNFTNPPTGTAGGSWHIKCGENESTYTNEGRAPPVPRPVLMPGLAAPKAKP